MTRAPERPPLDHISTLVLQRIHSSLRAGLSPHFRFVDFHGFQKAMLPPEILDDVLASIRLTPPTIQVEFAGVLTDLTNEVHIHKQTEAYVTCIGEDCGLQDPRNAYAFLSDRWLPLKCGDHFSIPPNTPHGFTVDPGGWLYFLSVQSPPIVSSKGSEDYFRHLCTPRP